MGRKVISTSYSSAILKEPLSARYTFKAKIKINCTLSISVSLFKMLDDQLFRNKF